MSSPERTPAAQSRHGNHSTSPSELGHTAEAAEHAWTVEEGGLIRGPDIDIWGSGATRSTDRSEALALEEQRSGVEFLERGSNATDHLAIEIMKSGRANHLAERPAPARRNGLHPNLRISRLLLIRAGREPMLFNQSTQQVKQDWTWSSTSMTRLGPLKTDQK